MYSLLATPYWRFPVGCSLVAIPYIFFEYLRGQGTGQEGSVHDQQMPPLCNNTQIFNIHFPGNRKSQKKYKIYFEFSPVAESWYDSNPAFFIIPTYVQHIF